MKVGEGETSKSGFLLPSYDKLYKKGEDELRKKAFDLGANVIYIKLNQVSQQPVYTVRLVAEFYKSPSGGDNQTGLTPTPNLQENLVSNINNGIDFKLTSCARDAAAQTVTIYFSFSNPRKVHQRLVVYGSGYSASTKAIDENGSQVMSKAVSLANVNSNFATEIELINGGVIKGSITFMNVLPNVSKLSLVNIYVQNSNWDGGGDRKEGIIEIKNLTIDAKINPDDPKPIIDPGQSTNDNIVKNIDNGLDFFFSGCKGDSKKQTVTVYFAFSNPRKVNQKIQVFGSDYNSNTKSIDENGNQIRSKSVSLANVTGNFNIETELIYGSKIDGSITFINVLPTMTKLSLVNINTSSSNWDGDGDRKNGIIEIKNISIKWDNNTAGSPAAISMAGYLTYNDLLVKLNNGESTANKKVILDNIYFETNQDVITENSKTTLQNILRLLIKYPKVKITILGHTDNVGRDDDNQSLSFSRAKAVVTYLVSKGINRDRLFYKGFGSSVPIDDNSTAEGRAKNRRTEMEIMEQ
jgi:outer membrane protein OmpA-like peptidoglycan-associated protein